MLNKGRDFEWHIKLATKFNLQRNLSKAQFNLGAYYEKIGDIDRAIECFEACQSDPESANRLISTCWDKAAHSSEGLKYYQKALSCAITTRSSRIAEARNRLGLALQVAGLSNEAMEQHQMELNLSIENKDLTGELRAREALAHPLRLSRVPERSRCLLRVSGAHASDSGLPADRSRSPDARKVLSAHPGAWLRYPSQRRLRSKAADWRICSISDRISADMEIS